jgi:hypothetical protein
LLDQKAYKFGGQNLLFHAQILSTLQAENKVFEYLGTINVTNQSQTIDVGFLEQNFPVHFFRGSYA